MVAPYLADEALAGLFDHGQNGGVVGVDFGIVVVNDIGLCDGLGPGPVEQLGDGGLVGVYGAGS